MSSKHDFHRSKSQGRMLTLQPDNPRTKERAQPAQAAAGRTAAAAAAPRGPASGS